MHRKHQKRNWISILNTTNLTAHDCNFFKIHVTFRLYSKRPQTTCSERILPHPVMWCQVWLELRLHRTVCIVDITLVWSQLWRNLWKIEYQFVSRPVFRLSAALEPTPISSDSGVHQVVAEISIVLARCSSNICNCGWPFLHSNVSPWLMPALTEHLKIYY